MKSKVNQILIFSLIITSYTVVTTSGCNRETNGTGTYTMCIDEINLNITLPKQFRYLEIDTLPNGSLYVYTFKNQNKREEAFNLKPHDILDDYRRFRVHFLPIHLKGYIDLVYGNFEAYRNSDIYQIIEESDKLFLNKNVNVLEFRGKRDQEFGYNEYHMYWIYSNEKYVVECIYLATTLMDIKKDRITAETILNNCKWR